MTLGISTYAYLWRASPRQERPMTLDEIFDDAVRLGLDLVQVCDWPPLEGMDAAGLARMRAAADERGLALETGTRGAEPDHLLRHLRIAEALGARLVRSMAGTPSQPPDVGRAAVALHHVAPRFEEAGVALALETYEQVSTADLVWLVEQVGSSAVGICLDPGNVVGAFEHPGRVIDLAAPHTLNVHVKDFSFARNPDQIGFRLTGAPLGEGRLELDHLLAAVRPAERGVNLVIEQWCPWQDDARTTAELEAAWCERSVRVLTAPERRRTWEGTRA
jgi:sugar phosphate isomerase/epimerase